MRHNGIPFFVIFLLIAGGTPPLWADQEEQKPIVAEDQCIACHQENDNLPEDFDRNDIHLQPGLSCAGCHGGDPTAEDMEEAMNPEKGYIGVPSRTETPQFCGRCHSSIDFMRTYEPRIATDQVDQYYTSVHGQRLRQGDEKVAECVSCHTAHAILRVKDPRSSVYALNVPETCNRCHGDAEYMQEYQIPIDPYEKFARSVHGVALLENKDIGAPACNDCHGNHGAKPPGVESVSHVCGQCHVNNMNYFSKSVMGEVFRETDLHACEQCHGHHEVRKTNDNMVGVGEGSVCLTCHSEGDKGYEAATKIHTFIQNFVDTLTVADSLLSDVQRKGMDDVEILFSLQKAKQDLIRSRTLVHTFNPNKIQQKTSEGLAKTRGAMKLAYEEIRDFHTRRRGFGVAILFIAVLAVGLFLKIREIERGSSS